MECLFDKILAGEVHVNTVYEDEDVLAFKDIHPVAPYHVLVIPRKKKISFVDLKDADVREVGIYIKKVSYVASCLGLDQSGYRIVFNCGAQGGQTVDYIHAHILGGRDLTWPPG